MKKGFTPASFVLFRSGYTLRKHLVRLKMYLLSREKGSSYCRKSRYETGVYIKETDTFQSFVIKKFNKINHLFNCDSECVNNPVSGLQYIGSTVEEIRFRRNNYTRRRSHPPKKYIHELKA